MTLQSTVKLAMAAGVVGDLSHESPLRSKPYVLNSVSAAYNVVGRAFTVDSEGVAKAGGTGVFAGILANPKVYPMQGDATGTLAPTLTLPNNATAELVTMGEIFVTLPAVAAIGDDVLYDTTTGALSTVADVATFTASQATTVLTVTAITAGNLGVGSVVRQASGSLSTIIALGTGTGGTGTYTLDTSQTVSSGAATANSVAPSGKAFVPNAVVSEYTVTAAGLAKITLTNQGESK